MVIQTALIITMIILLCLLCLLRCYIYTYIYILYIQVCNKTLKPNSIVSLFYVLSVQEINSDSKDERLNFMLPGCLTPFKDEICSMFAIEKRKFLANKRFNAVFSNTSLQPLFQNRQNLKKLVSRNKVK